MKSASWPRSNRLEERLLVIQPHANEAVYTDAQVKNLGEFLCAGDLVVVNDAATFPASLHTQDRTHEVRLLAREATGHWRAVLFGLGDWHTPTEDRPPPRVFARGERLEFAEGFYAEVENVAPESSRLVTLHFNLEPSALWTALYRYGHMIQYSYLERELESWSAQTAYGSRPWAVEMPSAGRPLSAGLLLELRRQGIGVAALTHAAGISSTGEANLDGLLPLRERYDIPAHTVEAIASARARGGHVIAVGTSVVRALEGNAANNGGRLVAEAGETDLILGEHLCTRPLADGIISGMHNPSESHYRLLRAFTSEDVLREGLRRAESWGYLTHEFGDSCLIFTSCSTASLENGSAQPA